MHHRDREREALTDAQRQAGGGLVGIGFEIEFLCELGAARLDAIGRQVEKPRVQRQILCDGQLAIQRKRLRHIADLHPRLQVVRVNFMAKYARVACAGRQKAGQHFHGRGLAAAVRTQKAENLAGGDAKAHIFNGLEVAKMPG